MTLLVGDCVEVMAGMPAASVDAIVTDPPYGLEFMGKDWDRLGGDAGMTKPGIGERPTAWPSFGGSEFGGANPTCATCGGRARGARRCECETPDWRVKGLPLTDGFRRQDNPADVGREDVFGRTTARAPEYRAGHAMQEWHEAWAREAFRVLKPGGHLLAFGGTRTYHRLACAIEDAGFEIRDTIAWMYGSGFPKSLDVSKAIDKAAGAEREVVGPDPEAGRRNKATPRFNGTDYAGGEEWQGAAEVPLTAPTTEDARRWEGFGTALKPAHEPIVVARKPLAGTVAANVLEHGTGALNIDGCRVEAEGGSPSAKRTSEGRYREERVGESFGRWPANVVLAHTEECVEVGARSVRSDGHYPSARPGGVEIGAVGHAGQSELVERHTKGERVSVWECAPDCPVRMLDEQTGDLPRAGGKPPRRNVGEDGRLAYGSGWHESQVHADAGPLDAGGGPSRFFYTAKASRAERNAGLDGFDEQPSLKLDPTSAMAHDGRRGSGQAQNHHPTVKPIALMRWLVRLVTPPSGTVLDPFTGSGTTGCAAALEGFEFIGIERDPDYAKIAEARIRFWSEHGDDGLRIVRDRERAAERRATVEAAGQMTFDT